MNTKKIIQKQQERFAANACERYFKEYGEIKNSTIDSLNSAIDAMMIDNEDKAYSAIVLSEEASNLITKKIIS